MEIIEIKENFSKGEKQLYATALLKSLVENQIFTSLFLLIAHQKFDIDIRIV